FDQNRQDVALSAVPRLVVQALLSTEDRRFYDHHGVDLRGMLRAAVHNATAGGAEGGCTLTMQLVKQERAYRARTPAEQQRAVRHRRTEGRAHLVLPHPPTQGEADSEAARPVGLASSHPPPVRQGGASTPPDVVNVGFFCDYLVGWVESHGVSAGALRTGGL